MTKQAISILTTFLFTSLSFQLQAQVQWASEVLEVSSEHKQEPVGKGYLGIQALGKPDVLPAYGESPCAWSPAKKENRADEFLKVGFASPQAIQQIVIAESWGAGAITKVFVYGTGGEVKMVYEDKINRVVSKNGRMLRITFPQTSFAVKAVKIMMSTIDIPGWNQIDAIGISESRSSIEAKINLSENSLGTATLLPREINSPYNEVLPIISPDGESLFFVRKNHPENIGAQVKTNDDIWSATKLGESWGNVKHIPAPLNNDRNNYVASITPDGNTLLLGNTYGDASGKTGMSVSHRRSDGWSFPEKLTIDNHYNWSRYEEFSMANNGKTLLLAVLRRDSEGEKDLYASFMREDGTWSEPKTLGPMVNSPADEAAPFLASDQRTLYYASKGFSGYGDFDLFVSKRLDDSWTNWSEPENLGPMFNSQAMDASFAIDAKGEYAYFSSAKYDAYGNGDLFRAPLPEDLQPDPVVLVYGKVFNAQDSTPIGAKIIYEQLKTGDELGIAYSASSTGDYKITLPLHENYGFFAASKGFLAIDDHIDLTTTDDIYYEVHRDLYLVPIEEGQAIRLNNIFFAQSEASLLEGSYPELNRLAKTLTNNPSMEIVLEGHTDIIGDPSKNMKLSKERVEVVKDYLVKAGVDKKRIETKAFGGTQPLSRLRTNEAQKANRRVEVRIAKL